MYDQGWAQGLVVQSAVSLVSGNLVVFISSGCINVPMVACAKGLWWPAPKGYGGLRQRAKVHALAAALDTTSPDWLCLSHRADEQVVV